MTNTTVHRTEFVRNGWIVNAMPTAAVIFMVAGVGHILMGEIGQAALWVAMGLAWWFNYLWSKKMPFIVVDDDSFTLRTALVLPSKTIPWNGVMGLQSFGFKRVRLLLVTGRRIKIYLININAADRKKMIQVFEDAIAKKGAGALAIKQAQGGENEG